MQLHTIGVTEKKRIYTPVDKVTFPTPDDYFLISRSYDCNGIYLSKQHFARFAMGTPEWALNYAMEYNEGLPKVIDARTPFLKGEPVTLDEGAIIPFGWQPNTRRLAGLNVPYGTIWPDGWKKGDPLPVWECCPPRLVKAEYEATKGY